MAVVIQAEGLGKRYRLGEGGYVTLRERLAGLLRPGPAQADETHEIWAFRDVDLTVEEGDIVGIVGRNGAGKTTLLKTVARIVRPTTGFVRVRGRVGALLEVGTGFHPELTGRENVFLNGVVLGMSRREVKRRFDDIVEFAGVERFLDTPLKRYSSGMYLRLAFAVAAHVEPDVVIVDEVLAVGDAEFQRRCLGRMSEFGREGRTVLFVSHDTGVVGQLCQRAIWLDEGRVQAQGSAHDVLDRYLRTSVQAARRIDVSLRPHSPIGGFSLSLVGAQATATGAHRRNEPLTFEIELNARRKIVGVDPAIYIVDRHGVRIVSEQLSFSLEPITGPAQVYRVRFRMAPVLAAGEYLVGVSLGDINEYFFRGELLRLTILPLPSDRADAARGAVRPDVQWQVLTEPGPESAT